jgi:DNA-binding response OmpR family regulator
VGEDAARLVLVVDDETDILALVATRLRQDGHRVITTESGDRALEIAREELPDLLVLDVRIPGTDGYAVTREIRADSRTEGIPILLLSASVGEEEVQEGLDAGANGYLRKPFQAEELRARVRELLAGDS